MKFTDRKEFLYDVAAASRSDSVTANRIYAEYVKKYSPNPTPLFFEVDLDQSIDPLWHVATSARTKFTQRSPISIAAINQFQKPDWRLTKIGITPQRRDNFYLSNLLLQQADYFPTRGDQVYWNGYRYAIISAVPPPEAYWHQTGVWLGLLVECIIVPEGDARPLQDLSEAAPSEVRNVLTMPRPEK